MRILSITARRALQATALLGLLYAGAGHAQSGQTPETTLFERLGGLPAISVLLSDFVDDFVADPVIMANSAVRERKNADNLPYLKFQLTTLVCESTGGPCTYAGASMSEAHEGLGVTEAQWQRMVEIFSQSLAQHGVPEGEQQALFELIGPTKDDIVVAGGQ